MISPKDIKHFKDSWRLTTDAIAVVCLIGSRDSVRIGAERKLSSGVTAPDAHDCKPLLRHNKSQLTVLNLSYSMKALPGTADLVFYICDHDPCVRDYIHPRVQTLALRRCRHSWAWHVTHLEKSKSPSQASRFTAWLDLVRGHIFASMIQELITAKSSHDLK